MLASFGQYDPLPMDSPGCWREVRGSSRKSFLKNRAYSRGPAEAGKARGGELNLLLIPGRIGGRPLRPAPASFVGSERGHKSHTYCGDLFAQACTGFHRETYRFLLPGESGRPIVTHRLSREALKTLRHN